MLVAFVFNVVVIKTSFSYGEILSRTKKMKVSEMNCERGCELSALTQTWRS